jgi:hypothetical protein
MYGGYSVRAGMNMSHAKSKGMTIIAEVVFLAIIITLIFLVYSIASPLLYSMQASSAFDQAKSMMLSFDEVIQDVASHGGRRSFHVTLGSGTAALNESTDSILWHMDTETMVVSPRSMQSIGNLIVGSNLDVMAYEGSYSGTDAYVLENGILRVFIRKIGSEASPQQYHTSDLLMGVYNKNLLRWMPLERLEISVDRSQESMNGTGYTELAVQSYNLPRGEVLAHINTSYSLAHNYTVSFSLESGADFLTIAAVS